MLQLAEFVSAEEIILDYDVGMPWENVGRWELCVVLFHFAEVAVGLEDGIGVFEV